MSASLWDDVFHTAHQTTVARFSIQKIPKTQIQIATHEILPILENVIDTIIYEYKQAKEILDNGADCGNTFNIECYSFGFSRDGGVLVLPMVRDNAQTPYLNTLTDIDFGHFINMVSNPIKSELFDTIVKNCSINVDKLLLMCFEEIDTHDHKLTTISSLGKPSIPDWVMTLVNMRLMDLLNRSLIDMLTITDDLVIKCINTILSKANVSRQSSITIPVFTQTSPRKHATSMPTASNIPQDDVTIGDNQL